MDFKSPISNFMSRKPVTISPSDRMSSIKDIFANQKIHHVLVMDHSSLVGLVSKEDYMPFQRCVKGSSYNKLIEDCRLYNYRVDEVMTKELVILDSTERISVALELFSKNIFSAIPVVDNGELVGLLTTYDIIKALVEENHSMLVSQ